MGDEDVGKCFFNHSSKSTLFMPFLLENGVCFEIFFFELN